MLRSSVREWFHWSSLLFSLLKSPLIRQLRLFCGRHILTVKVSALLNAIKTYCLKNVWMSQIFRDFLHECEGLLSLIYSPHTHLGGGKYSSRSWSFFFLNEWGHLESNVTSTHCWEITRYLTGRNLGMPRSLCKAPDTWKVMAWLKACPNLHHRDNLSFQDRAELGLSPTYSMEILFEFEFPRS